VVVGYDGSKEADVALEQAAKEAKARCAQLEVIVSWRYWPAKSITMVTPDFAHDAQAIADKAADQCRSIDADLASRIRISPEPAPLQLVGASVGADLLVVGQRGLGAFTGMVLGSVSQYCAHHASCPVMVTRDGNGDGDGGQIVVGFDGSEGSRRALAWGAEEAILRSCPIRVVSAWFGAEVFVTPSEAEEVTRTDVEEVGADLRRERPGIHVTTEVVEARAASALIAACRDASMLVVGSRGRGGFRGLLLGSVGLHCLHHASRTVVVVPSAHTN